MQSPWVAGTTQARWPAHTTVSHPGPLSPARWGARRSEVGGGNRTAASEVRSRNYHLVARHGRPIGRARAFQGLPQTLVGGCTMPESNPLDRCTSLKLPSTSFDGAVGGQPDEYATFRIVFGSEAIPSGGADILTQHEARNRSLLVPALRMLSLVILFHAG